MMKRLAPFVMSIVSCLAPGNSVLADVGQCYVMCVCGIEGQLDARQQHEVGTRIMEAHMASGQSDGHIVFVCLISTNSTDGEMLYSIETTAVGDGDYPVHGYQITAPNFEGTRHAVAEIEAASAHSRIHQLQEGVRTEVLERPLYEEEPTE